MLWRLLNLWRKFAYNDKKEQPWQDSSRRHYQSTFFLAEFMNDEPRLSLHTFKFLLRALEKLDIATAPLLREINFDPIRFKNLNEMMPYTDQVKTMDLAIEATNNPQIGLLAGRYVHPSDYGILGHLMMNCKTLGEALYIGSKYQHLMVTDGIINKFWSEGGLIHYSTIAPTFPMEKFHSFSEMHLSSTLHMAAFLTNREYNKSSAVLPEEVWFCHKQTGNLSTYENILKCTVRFNMPTNKISFSPRLLQLPIYSPNPQLFEVLLDQIEPKNPAKTPTPPFKQQVQNHILKNIPFDPPAIDDIAVTFSLTTRTFQRRLKNINTTYSDLCKQSHVKLAKNLLEATDQSLGEIAFLLGFSDNSTFHRAFKKWTGKTPKQYQKESLIKTR